MKLEGIGAFLATVDAGSISEAARQLGISKSVVSARVAELERAVVPTLLHRTTRRLSVTEDGQAFCARARVIVQALADATAELSERRGTLTGPLEARRRRAASGAGACLVHEGESRHRHDDRSR